jgi:hypothetical protein
LCRSMVPSLANGGLLGAGASGAVLTKPDEAIL